MNQYYIGSCYLLQKASIIRSEYQILEHCEKMLHDEKKNFIKFYLGT